ncbi:MAG: glycosyltransferase family 2 protein [Steroidobacteraceae bacterium]
MKLSVIVSTYNQPDWLELCLWGLAAQSERDFEVLIADDGSDEATALRIERTRAATGLQIRHVWHADDGFRKCAILNKAVSASGGDYLVFTDGDCLLRKDFVATHLRFRQTGYFLSGGYCKLPMQTSKRVTADVVTGQQVFDVGWLRANGLTSRRGMAKLRSGPRIGAWLDAITPTQATWNGHNASGWKTDIVGANGFDERMAYGGEDRELGERMRNAGIRARQIRHRAIVVHLDHARGYVSEAAIARNRQIRAETAAQKRTWTPFGLIRAADPR